MAAISRLLTIRLVATRLGEDEDLLWDLADAMEPEDGKIWIVDRDDETDLAASLASPRPVSNASRSCWPNAGKTQPEPNTRDPVAFSGCSRYGKRLRTL